MPECTAAGNPAPSQARQSLQRGRLQPRLSRVPRPPCALCSHLAQLLLARPRPPCAVSPSPRALGSTHALPSLRGSALLRPSRAPRVPRSSCAASPHPVPPILCVAPPSSPTPLSRAAPPKPRSPPSPHAPPSLRDSALPEWSRPHPKLLIPAWLRPPHAPRGPRSPCAAPPHPVPLTPAWPRPDRAPRPHRVAPPSLPSLRGPALTAHLLLTASPSSPHAPPPPVPRPPLTPGPEVRRGLVLGRRPCSEPPTDLRS